MAEENKNIGTSDMPEAKTMNYSNIYKVAPVFINDLKIILRDTAYVEAKRLLDVIEMYKGEFPAAVLNEFINKLARMPYKTVEPIMKAIENKDTFIKYFILKENKE